MSAMAARAHYTCGSGDRGPSFVATHFLHANRHPPRIKSKGMLRSKTPQAVQNGSTIPTRGISVTIQPNLVVVRSSIAIGGTAFEAGKVFTACRIRNMQTAQFEIQRE